MRTQKSSITIPETLAPLVLSDKAAIPLPDAYITQIKKFSEWHAGPVRFSVLRRYFEQMDAKPATKAVAKFAIKKVLRQQLLEENRLADLASLDAFFGQIKTGKSKRKVEASDVISEAELNRIRQDGEPRAAVACEMLYVTGLRIAELAQIRVKDCVAIRKVVHITVIGKGKKQRRIMIGKGLFRRVQGAFGIGEYLLNRKGKKPYSTRHLRRLVVKCGNILGRKIWPHLLRHSMATHTLARTRKIQAVSEYLGHSSPSITLQMYVHEELSAKDLRLT